MAHHPQHVALAGTDDDVGYVLLKGRGALRGQRCEKEREVLAFVADGKTNAEIAVVLGISARTAVAVRALATADVTSARASSLLP